MTESKYKFNIQTSNRGAIDIALTEGKALFVLGANGAGKSTLMQNLFNQNFGHTKRILAHRQTWFTENSMSLTAAQKKQTEENIRYTDNQVNSRWKDEYSQQRSSISIFDLINSENIRARKIAGAVDEGDMSSAKEHSNVQAPIQAINELFAISNIPVVIELGKDEQLLATKNGSQPYSISELSDGERNALLICADVLTTEPNQLIILDEPERHLHRSIISPLLSTLFRKRKDCVFVISTHDVHLPIDHSSSSTLLLRGCRWEQSNILDWDADLVTETDEIPAAVKQEILGSKRNILFVEGNAESLDRQIYQLIYPAVTVISQGNCSQVEKAVEGIRGTESLHWVNAYGLIDADDRTESQLQTLLQKGIAALECYSVESLYYHPEIVRRIAERKAEFTGGSKEELYSQATSGIISALLPHRERLCSRLCEKHVRNEIMSRLPKQRDFAGNPDFQINLNLAEVVAEEAAVFDKLVADEDLSGLISRYPIRETPVINVILSGLKLDKDSYESSVRKLIIDEDDTLLFYRNLLLKLTELIDAPSV